MKIDKLAGKLNKSSSKFLDRNLILSSNYFLTGLELEFTINPNLDEKYYSNNLKPNSIFGTDGNFGCKNSTKEFRTPVFYSKNLDRVFIHLTKFVCESVDFLCSEYQANFSPSEKIDEEYTSLLGLHFSISNTGKFGKLYPEINTRAMKIADSLDSIFDPFEITRFNNRAGYWSHKTNSDNWRKEQEDRIEYRFFPSCDIRTVIPYLEYIYFGGDIPNTFIKVLRNHEL